MQNLKKQILDLLGIDSISLEKDRALTDLLSLDDKIAQATSSYFVDFCRQHLYAGEWDRKHLYWKFVNLYPGQINLSVSTFALWLRIYCAFHFDFYGERKSNGKYLINLKD